MKQVSSALHYKYLNEQAGSIPSVWGELAEDKGTSFGLQGRYVINH